MSPKPDSSRPRGVLSEIWSFVFTVIVVAFAMAFLAALFTGGLAGAGDLAGAVLQWLFEVIERVGAGVTAIVEGDRG